MNAAGLSNFRDFGGVARADGRRVLAGRLFRSAAPGALSASDADVLAGHAITTVIDLRGAAEQRIAPTLNGPAAIVSAPVEPKASGKIRELMASGTVGAPHMRQVMIETYQSFVRDEAPAFGAAFAAILNADGPILIHCTAGKDRTGFVAAVLLSALGAPRDWIVADYLETNQAWNRASIVGHLPLEPSAMAPVLAADADYLAAALEEIERRHGDAASFIALAGEGRIDLARLEDFIEEGERA